MPHASSERGAASLVEILIAIAIVGIAFTGILGGMANVALGSRLHHERSEAQIVLSSAADILRSDDIAFGGCTATAAGYETPLRAAFPAANLPTGWPSTVISVTSVRLWNGTAFVASNGTTQADCVNANGLLDLQLVGVQVTTPDGRTSEATVVVKE
jgi:type II secretory pathway pseudopilin PulG